MIQCMYCGWQKGTSWDEAMSSSEEINPVALSLAELRLSEGTSLRNLISRNLVK